MHYNYIFNFDYFMLKKIIYHLLCLSSITLHCSDTAYNPMNQSIIRLLNKNDPKEISQVQELYDNYANYENIKKYIDNPNYISPNSKTHGLIEFFVHSYASNPQEILGVLERVTWEQGPKSVKQISVENLIVQENHRRQNIASQLIKHLEKTRDKSILWIIITINKNDNIMKNFGKKNNYSLSEKDSNRPELWKKFKKQ